jgi:hypothetical protein
MVLGKVGARIWIARIMVTLGLLSGGYFCFFWAGTVGVGRTTAQGSFALCSGIALIVAL